MELNINGKKVELKYTMRAMIMYENITNAVFSPKTISDIITLFYCVVLSSMKDYTLTFEGFLDWLDENTDELTNFSQWLQDINGNTERLKKN